MYYMGTWSLRDSLGFGVDSVPKPEALNRPSSPQAKKGTLLDFTTNSQEVF